MITMQAQALSRPLNQVFTIARGSKTSADVVVIHLSKDGAMGRGEAVPYARYGETQESVLAMLEGLPELTLEADLQSLLPAGAARNALDCALWDLRAKQTGQSAASLAGVSVPEAVRTAQTLSLDEPENMAAAAGRLSQDALIKVKLGGEGDIERLRAIRAARPFARLIVDANEGWSQEDYQQMIPELQSLGIEMIEQPFPADEDGVLAELHRPIPICADESAHVAADVAKLKDRYDMINIKLDKTGGLSEALRMKDEADRQNMPYMIGCMVASSLAMAPAYLLSGGARYVDLDGPLFIKDDEEPKIEYRDGIMNASSPELWG